LITGNYRFLTLLGALLVHTVGVLSHQAHAQGIKKNRSFISNLGNLEVFNQGGSEESPNASKIAEPASKEAVATPSSHPSPPSQDALTKKESVMSDEELEFLLFGSIDEVGLPVTESKENDFIELAESKSWLPSISASVGFGVSDNPMYGPYIRESSTYMEFETESFLLRQANPDYLSYFYFYGEGKRFLEVDNHKLSGILLVQGEHSYRPKNSPGSGGLKLRHTYYDQAFDFSDLGLPFTMQVQSNKSEIIPHFGYQLTPKIKLSAKTAFGVDRYDNPSENNSDQKIQVDLTAKQSEQTTLNAKIFHHTIRYIERKRKDGDGTNLPEGNLQTKKTGISGSWEKQSKNPWLDTIGAELKYRQLSDNAGAYYDYSKISAKVSHEMKGEKWKSVSELGWANYLYDTRSVSPGTEFERQSYGVDLLVTRKISTDWETYFKWRYEEDQSNARDYEYYTNFWALGIKWEN
jgi:dihydroneopterin aldolase